MYEKFVEDVNQRRTENTMLKCDWNSTWIHRTRGNAGY